MKIHYLAWFKISDLQTGSPIVDTILGAIIISAGILGVYMIWTFIATSAKKEYFSDKDIEDARQHFVANNIMITDADSVDITPSKFNLSSHTIADLITHIVNGKQKFYFLSASTGIGKTTFLLNFFNRYWWSSVCSVKGPLLLGHIHNRATRDKIHALTSKDSDSLLNKLRKKMHNPKRTILLLDGFDEFAGSFLTAEEFWNAFNDNWNNIANDLSMFGKVIITVREQFLQHLDQNTQGLRSPYLDNSNFHYIKLKHFSLTQVNSYVEKRYKGSAKYTTIKQTLSLLNNNRLARTDDMKLTQIPLILSYLEDLTPDGLRASARSRNKKLIDRFDVFSEIVNAWLLREKPKSVPLQDIVYTRKFCQELAFKLATEQQVAIEEKAFLEFEKNYFAGLSIEFGKSFISHFGDRSLLAKIDDGRAIRLKFVHRTFLEYFLADYLIEKVPDYQNYSRETLEAGALLLNGDKFDFTKELLIHYGWHRIKDDTNIIPDPGIPVSGDEHELNYITPELVSKWSVVPHHISLFGPVRSYLMESLPGRLAATDPNWLHYFKSLEHLAITNANFIAADPEEQIWHFEFIRFYKDFIQVVNLQNVTMEPIALECFNGAKNIIDLSLEKCWLSGDCLKYFAGSKSVIIRLVVSFNNFEDSDMGCFEGAVKLRMLGLEFNRFTENVMQHFAQSKELNAFLFEENDPYTEIDLLLENFPTDRKWSRFGLSNADFNTLIERYLSHSKDSLIGLRLHSCNITDDDLRRLADFTNLERIDLNVNTDIKGTTLRDIIPYLPHLETIDLSQTDIHPDALAVFVDHPGIKQITLCNCPPQNPVLVQQLEARNVTVQIYDLPNRPPEHTRMVERTFSSRDDQ